MKTNWPAFRLGYILVAGVALAALPGQAQVAQLAATTASAPSASISRVEVDRTGQQTRVRIGGNRELSYQELRLSNPPRLVLDFADARLALAGHAVASEYLPVRDVRLGQQGSGQARVVIDLAKFVPYTVQTEGSNVTVSFTAPVAAPVPAAISPAHSPRKSKLVPAALPEMPLPEWLTGQRVGFARPAIEPPAPEAQNPPAAAPPAPVPQAQAPATPKYTGEPISVNLKDVDLKDFFRLIHEISGLNVVLDPTVKGSVTLVLDQVPWDQGLDIVLRNNGLAKEIDGNVLRIVTQETLRREAEQVTALAKAQNDAIETVTTTRVLSYAKADALVAPLKRFLTARGDLIADPRSNTLIIRDIPSSLPRIENLLRQLDRKSLQVEIDARVVLASRSFAREIGTQFGFSTPAGNTALGGLVGNSTFVSPVVHSNHPPFIPVTGGGSIPLNSNLGTVAPNSGITFTTQGHNYAVDFILSAMENHGVGKVLSEPRGVTQNNEKLIVKQGQQIPIQTNINNTISIQFVDAVLKLEVTPQVTADGTVFLEVSVENTQIDNGIPRILGTPALDTQSATTKVLITDGGTVVIGGVVTNTQTTSVDQVPLLGSVPLIGNLFRHTTIDVKSQELLFFVTPRILPG
jgi:type IV pilus assembly protein PilQ